MTENQYGQARKSDDESTLVLKTYGPKFKTVAPQNGDKVQNMKFYDQTYGQEDCPQTTKAPTTTTTHDGQFFITLALWHLYQMSQKEKKSNIFV